MVELRNFSLGLRISAATLVLFAFCGCSYRSENKQSSNERALNVYSMAPGAVEIYDRKFFENFGLSQGIHVRYDRAKPASVYNQLSLLQGLLARPGNAPEIVGVDVIWPPILDGELLDLRPYLGEALKDLEPKVLGSNKVGDRIVAIPDYVDLGVLYYRPSLLKRYGFVAPPKTWDELEAMAAKIQMGERSRGNRNFWGYAFQGAASEGLTCNVLEWFVSQGGTNLVDEDGVSRINNPSNVRALRRALSWIGRISPPGQAAYAEEDGHNMWDAGRLAFFRNWAVLFPLAAQARRFGDDTEPSELAPLPGGVAGRYGTLGGLSLGIARTAGNRSVAVAALQQFASLATEKDRAVRAGVIPARTSLRNSPGVMAGTPLHTPLAASAMNGIVLRPSQVAGRHYGEVSRAAFTRVNAVLCRKETPEAALASLEAQINRILQEGRIGDPRQASAH